MTSLDFLYIALGGGFIILVIFLCVMLLQLTLVLRDVTKITENFREVSNKIKETVFEPLKSISEMTAGFTFIHEIIEKIRARFEGSKTEDEADYEAPEEEESNGFSVKKLRK
jgi:hypothetical protein